MGIIKTAQQVAAEALRESERLRAENFRLNAILEYVAMMGDIEIPDEDNEPEGRDNE